MLKRPDPSPSELRRAHVAIGNKSESRRQRQARHRQRRRQGDRIYPVPVNDGLLGLMIGLNWFDEQGSRNREVVGRAIGERLAELADHMARR